MLNLIDLLLTVNNQNLKRLCFYNGLKTTGNKIDLAKRISKRLKNHGTNIPASVLSIDLGIKNLALCQLRIRRDENLLIEGRLAEPLATVENWTKVDVSDVLCPPESTSMSLSRFSEFTYNLVSLLTSEPANTPQAIIVEQQRFRTGRTSFSVQEWTIRVNTLEAMLAATLTCLRKSNNIVAEFFSVSPKRSKSFWDPQWINESRSPKTVQSSGTKSTRIGLTLGWLKSAICQNETSYSPVLFGQENLSQPWIMTLKEEKLNSSRQVLNIVSKLQPIFKPVTGSWPAHMQMALLPAKGDDLADCLCQSVAWVFWQRSSVILNSLVCGFIKESQDDVVAREQQRRFAERIDQHLENLERDRQFVISASESTSI